MTADQGPFPYLACWRGLRGRRRPMHHRWLRRSGRRWFRSGSGALHQPQSKGLQDGNQLMDVAVPADFGAHWPRHLCYRSVRALGVGGVVLLACLPKGYPFSVLDGNDLLLPLECRT